MFGYMTREVIREKESLTAIQFTLLPFIALKSFTCQLVTRGKPVKDRNFIKCNLYLTKVHLKCNCLNYVDSQYTKFSNKT